MSIKHTCSGSAVVGGAQGQKLHAAAAAILQETGANVATTEVVRCLALPLFGISFKQLYFILAVLPCCVLVCERKDCFE